MYFSEISGVIPGRADVFASLDTLDTTAIDLAPCILTAAIVVTCAIAKTTPFVTQPTESALALQDSSEKSTSLFFRALFDISHIAR